MKKVTISIVFDDEKLDALEFSLKKENSSVQERMDDALKSLYEKTVPEPVREYLDSKAAPVSPKPKRPVKSAASKAQPTAAKPSFSAIAPVKEDEKNG
ncbi:MAG: hypothetical protein EOM54_14830 [Clostridia bacterium]|nr:hypothetical protein [Clostridia bacterium]